MCYKIKQFDQYFFDNGAKLNSLLINLHNSFPSPKSVEILDNILSKKESTGSLTQKKTKKELQLGKQTESTGFLADFYQGYNLEMVPEIYFV